MRGTRYAVILSVAVLLCNVPILGIPGTSAAPLVYGSLEEPLDSLEAHIPLAYDAEIHIFRGSSVRLYFDNDSELIAAEADTGGTGLSYRMQSAGLQVSGTVSRAGTIAVQADFEGEYIPGYIVLNVYEYTDLAIVPGTGYDIDLLPAGAVPRSLEYTGSVGAMTVTSGGHLTGSISAKGTYHLFVNGTVYRGNGVAPVHIYYRITVGDPPGPGDSATVYGSVEVPLDGLEAHIPLADDAEIHIFRGSYIRLYFDNDSDLVVADTYLWGTGLTCTPQPGDAGVVVHGTVSGDGMFTVNADFEGDPIPGYVSLKVYDYTDIALSVGTGYDIDLLSEGTSAISLAYTGSVAGMTATPEGRLTGSAQECGTYYLFVNGTVRVGNGPAAVHTYYRVAVEGRASVEISVDRDLVYVVSGRSADVTVCGSVSTGAEFVAEVYSDFCTVSRQCLGDGESFTLTAPSVTGGTTGTVRIETVVGGAENSVVTVTVVVVDELLVSVPVPGTLR